MKCKVWLVYILLGNVLEIFTSSYFHVEYDFCELVIKIGTPAFERGDLLNGKTWPILSHTREFKSCTKVQETKGNNEHNIMRDID